MKARLAAGNWKMNGLVGDLAEVEILIDRISQPGCDVLICPPATLISRMHQMAVGSELTIGAQDCHHKNAGAHTGDLSAGMLADAGVSHVILGHSERRADHGETDALVAAKTRAVFERGLIAIVCVGETEAQRDAGETLAVVDAQLAGSLPDECIASHTVIAYEPIWAIGTGRTPSLTEIAAVHLAIRSNLIARFGAEGQSMRLLYGGSVKPDNAAEIFNIVNVDGALVGGASLRASDFGQIVEALNSVN